MAPQDAFETLVAAPLHEMDDAAWATWYPATAAFLVDPDAERRARASERLAMAVLRAESLRLPRSAAREHRSRTRLLWLLDQLDAAQARYSDTLDTFIAGLRWHGDDEPFTSILLPWLGRLVSERRSHVDLDRARAIQVLIRPADDDPGVHLNRCLSHLADPSNWVRGAAAHRLGAFVTTPDPAVAIDALVECIRQEELRRPGIAGAFWTSALMDLPDHGWTADRITAWMLDLLEQRPNTPAEDDLLFNDIAFHLHELCSQSPAAVRRMIDGGFVDLALMTASEERKPVPGMRPLVEELTRHARADVAEYARAWLAWADKA